MIKIAAAIGLVFGVMTVISGGAVIFGGSGVKEMAGNYLPFVVWFNFIAGFAYVAAGAGLFVGRGWSAPLSLAIAIVTGVVFLVFLAFVASGTPYEMRTVVALIFRGGLWGAIAYLAFRHFKGVAAAG